MRAVADRFAAALEAGHGAAACEQLSRAAAEAVERQEGVPCDRAIGRLDLRPGRVAAARVYMTNALVRVGADVAFLSRERAGWRIAAAGCVPEGGDPRGKPMTCEIES